MMTAHVFALQVTCQCYDPKALLKKWDSVFITIGIDRCAYGSSKSQALSRAVGRGASADAALNTLTLAGCACRAVAEHAGRKHVMAITSPECLGVERFFAFESSAQRDSFMLRLAESRDELVLKQQTGAGGATNQVQASDARSNTDSEQQARVLSESSQRPADNEEQMLSETSQLLAENEERMLSDTSQILAENEEQMLSETSQLLVENEERMLSDTSQLLAENEEQMLSETSQLLVENEEDILLLQKRLRNEASMCHTLAAQCLEMDSELQTERERNSRLANDLLLQQASMDALERCATGTEQQLRQVQVELDANVESGRQLRDELVLLQQQLEEARGQVEQHKEMMAQEQQNNMILHNEIPELKASVARLQQVTRAGAAACRVVCCF
jgi:chemotaxis protein histidine kinase CheA